MVIKFSSKNVGVASTTTTTAAAATTADAFSKKSKNKRSSNNTNNPKKVRSKQPADLSTSSSSNHHHHHRLSTRQLRYMIIVTVIISFLSIWKSTDYTFLVSQSNIEESMFQPTTTTTKGASINLSQNLTTTITHTEGTNNIDIASHKESASSNITTTTTTSTTANARSNNNNLMVTAEGTTTPKVYSNENIQIQDHHQQSTTTTTKTSTTYTLTPPFQIIQVGNSRSGTTFQYNLLDAIISLKTPSHIPLPSNKNRGFVSGWSPEAFKIRLQHQTPFLLKFHATKQIFKDLQIETYHNYTRSLLLNSTTSTQQQEFHYGVFSSGQIGSSYSLYTQNFTSLINCSLCEIPNYQRYFNLSTDDITTLQKHMHIYGIIRQCCGLQMSKYEIMRLNGCNITQYKISNNPSYPNCEYYNLSNVEQQMIESPIPYKSNSPRWNWKKPSDCDYYRQKVQKEKLQFMGKPFQGCPNGTEPTKNT